MQSKSKDKILKIANSLNNNELCDLINCLSNRFDLYFGSLNNHCISSEIDFACLNGNIIQINAARCAFDDLSKWDFFNSAMNEKEKTK